MLKRILLTVGLVAIICIIAISQAQADTTSDLSQKLVQIYQKRAYWRTDTQRLEQECLDLLGNVSNAEDSGLVYAQIAWILGQNGLTQPKKTASYCELALRYPLADTMTVRMYSTWASAIGKYYGEDSYVVANANLRIEIAEICMKGLRQIMSYNLPDTLPDISTLPPARLIDWGGSPDDPVYKETMREITAANEKREEFFRQKRLFRSRDAFIDKLVYLGKVDSGTKREIERLAHNILLNADDVNKVLSLIDKKLSKD